MTDERTIGDRYEIQSTLGRGGMATVYRARDRVLGRPVAIKVLADRYAGDEKFVTRFRREARASARLNQRNIVSVFDTGDTDGEHYIVMELVEGETLADLLRREGPMSTDRAARIAGTVARALQAAHDQGFVHRDVKPGNVMLTPSGDVKVMDFGIARAATDDTLTQTGIVLGTASYLSPEQSRGDPVDHRSDVYSLGCVLYEMVTGRPPFSGSPISVAYKHVNERPMLPSRVNREVPEELEAVVMRALEKEPDARFSSAVAFREAVTAAAEGEPTEPLDRGTAVLPVATEPLPAAPSMVRPRRWIPVALLAVGLLAAGIVALIAAGEDEPRKRGRNRPAVAQESPSPEESPVSDVPTVEEALGELEAAVEAALAAGLVGEDVGEKILEESRKAAEEHFKGKPEDAFKHLEEANTAIQVGLLEGDVASHETATSLSLRVEALGAAIQANPLVGATPQEEEGSDGDSGPGNSENAPGHNKGEGDD